MGSPILHLDPLFFPHCIIVTGLSHRRRTGLFAGGTAIIVGLLWAGPRVHRVTPLPPRVSIDPSVLVANGWDEAALTIDAGEAAARPRILVIENPHGVVVEDLVFTNHRWTARLRAGVLPGRVTLRVEIAGLPPATTDLLTTPLLTDSLEDGTPDILRLDDDRDRQSFRRWFTWLAEAQYFQPAENRPAEINDCAALIRYAYREALRAHESGWAEAAQVPLVPAFPAIAKYQYPNTPLGAALFRVRTGPFAASDTDSGAFAQFADAQTLRRFNTRLVGRTLDRALPGDLLFFRQDGGRMPFHSMIWLGPSQVRPDGQRYILYHTGPDGEDAGVMRRLTVPELMRYPQPEWRPVPANPAFLGVFRWNILRKAFDDENSRQN
jgi:uncharacterized protein YfaT (DUF1175 family)